MAPHVSIGLPVFNGGLYLNEAVDSILAQTFTDFELIVSDNASTDQTEQICQGYAAKDRRIRYGRNGTNRGASWNFNRTFELSSGKYFKWVAHDDVCEPDFLAKCLAVLERDSSVVLCYPGEIKIDQAGRHLGEQPYKLRAAFESLQERFRHVILVNRGSPAIFGLMRAEALKKTGLIGYYAGSDRVLLAELALRGRLQKLPESLLLHREHPLRSVHAHPTGQLVTAWFDPAKKGKIVLPAWRLFFEYGAAIRRAPLGVYTKASCYVEMTRWLRKHGIHMMQDASIAAAQLLHLAPR